MKPKAGKFRTHMSAIDRSKRRKELAKNVGQLTVYSTDKDGNRTKKIYKARQVEDFVEEIEKGNKGRTYSGFRQKVKRDRRVEYKKDGNLIKVNFGRSGRDIEKRKNLLDVVTGEKVEAQTVSPEVIKRRIKASQAVQSLGSKKVADGYKEKREKGKIKESFENIDSSHISDKAIDYKVGIGTAQQSTRYSRGTSANATSGNDSGFAHNTESKEMGFGVKEEKKQENPQKSVSGGGGDHITFNSSFTGEHVRKGGRLEERPEEIRSFERRDQARIFNYDEYLREQKASPLMSKSEEDDVFRNDEEKITETDEQKGPGLQTDDTLSMFDHNYIGTADDYEIKRVEGF